MDARVAAELRALNRAFYDFEGGAQFSEKRRRSWPGWQRVLGHVRRDDAHSLDDVGCGNGRFLAYVREAGYPRAHYTGIDSSPVLIEQARARAQLGDARFIENDVFADADLAVLGDATFDWIVLWGILHHIPGRLFRARLLDAVVRRLRPQGVLAFSIWRFTESERIRRRMVAWEHAPAFGLRVDAVDVEPGDALVRWGHGPNLVRYCHAIDDRERDEWIAQLRAAGCTTIDHYRGTAPSDELNEYIVTRSTS